MDGHRRVCGMCITEVNGNKLCSIGVFCIREVCVTAYQVACVGCVVRRCKGVVRKRRGGMC